MNKQLKLYRLECKTISHRIENFIKDNARVGSIEQFFDNEMFSLDSIDEFIEHFEVNMYASYHLMKKLDRETQQLNLKVLENFLDREVKDPESPYIYLARASRVGALIEAYRLKIQLIGLNKQRILESEISGGDKVNEGKLFDKKLTEFKNEFFLVEKRYKQHQNLWLRCSVKLNSVELYDDVLYSEAENLKRLILKNWKKVFGETKLKIPKSAEEELKKGTVKKQESASYNDFSAWLVIIHTMIYMLIYYGNAPTAPSYSKALEFPESLTGVVQAATPLAAFISTFHYSNVISTSYKGGYAVSFLL